MTRAERQKLEDLLTLLALPAGQRFLADLIYGHCGLMRTAALDGMALAYHEGRRAIGRELNEAVVNANRGAVPALLGTFLAEQDRAARDIDDRQRADDGDPLAPVWERDQWGDPIPGPAREPDARGDLALPDDGSALG